MRFVWSLIAMMPALRKLIFVAYWSIPVLQKYEDPELPVPNDLATLLLQWTGASVSAQKADELRWAF